MSFSSARERERGLNVRTWSQLKSFVDIEQISLPATPSPPRIVFPYPTPYARTSRGGGIYIYSTWGREENRSKELLIPKFWSAQSYRHSWSTRHSVLPYLRSFEINFDIYCVIENSRLIMINCKDDGRVFFGDYDSGGDLG